MKFPRTLKGPKNHLVTGSRVFGGLLVHWDFSSVIWIPILRFGEVLSSLFPIESCGDSMCTALLKMAQKGSWIESHWSDAVLLLWLLPGCFPGSVNSYQMGPVWCGADPPEIFCKSISHTCWWNSASEFSAWPPCCVCMASHWRSVQCWGRSLRWAKADWLSPGSGNGARPLVDVSWSLQRHLGPGFAVLLQHSISILPVLKEMFYSISVSYLSCNGGYKIRRQEVRFEPRSPMF